MLTWLHFQFSATDIRRVALTFGLESDYVQLDKLVSELLVAKSEPPHVRAHVFRESCLDS
jgi:hypothetical protein